MFLLHSLTVRFILVLKVTINNPTGRVQMKELNFTTPNIKKMFKVIEMDPDSTYDLITVLDANRVSVKLENVKKASTMLKVAECLDINYWDTLDKTDCEDVYNAIRNYCETIVVSFLNLCYENGYNLI